MNVRSGGKTTAQQQQQHVAARSSSTRQEAVAEKDGAGELNDGGWVTGWATGYGATGRRVDGSNGGGKSRSRLDSVDTQGQR